MPRHIHVNLTDASGRTYSHMCDISDGAVSFLVNTRLSRLSWEFADAQIDFHTLKRSWRTVLKSPAPFPAWVVTILVAVANASFCRLFGGDAPAMAMVFIATYIGFLLKGLLSAKKMDMRLVFVICSFASAIICTGAVASGLTQTPRIAVSTCILYLVPGIPFINSLSDMLAHHYICAFGRFINATVLTCCLSLGLSVGLLMLHYALL